MPSRSRRSRQIKPGVNGLFIILLITVLFAATVKAVVLSQLHAHPLLQPTGGLDSEVYVQLARRAAAGDWALGPQPYFVSPLYVYFLAVVLRLTGSLLAAQALQVVLGTLAVGLVFAAARRLYSDAAALAAAILAAGTGIVTFHEVLLLQSALDPFLAALGLALLARALDTGRRFEFGLVGLAIGLQALNRPNVLLWLVVLVALLAATRARRRGAAAVVFGAVAAIAPVTLRNRAVSGEWVLVSSHGGLNFYIGNNPEADGTYHAVPGITPSIEGQARDARLVAQAALGHQAAATETSRYFSGLAWRWIRQEPARALGLFVRKVAYTLNATDLSLNYSFDYYRGDERTALRVLAVGPWLLVPLGLLGLAAVPTRPGLRGPWIWKSFIPVYALSVAAFFVAGRYRLPLLIALCVTSGAAAVRLFALARERRAGPLASAAAGLAVLGLLANWDFGLDDGRANERTEMIVWLIDQGRTQEALALLARTGTTHPRPAALHHRAGRALLEAGRLEEGVTEMRAARAAGAGPEVEADLARGLAALGRLALEADDPARAEALLSEAVARAPSSAEALEAHGLALFRLGRLDAAAAELEAACANDPRGASARLNLAVVRAQQGRYGEARARAGEALRLRPDYPEARGLLAALDGVERGGGGR